MNWKTMKAGKEKYHAYLASRDWAVKKEAVHARCESVCERCEKAKAENVHHQTYIRLYDEKLDDLLGVCRKCHEFLSGKTDVDPTLHKGLKLHEVSSLFDFKERSGITSVKCPVCQNKSIDITGLFLIRGKKALSIFANEERKEEIESNGSGVCLYFNCKNQHSFCINFHTYAAKKILVKSFDSHVARSKSILK